MRALQYEGTPWENAQSFKEQGNEMVKVKRWKDGQEFYAKALIILQKSRLERKRQPPDTSISDEEGMKEQQLEEVCLVNRALCNLELSESKAAAPMLMVTVLNLRRKLQIYDTGLCHGASL